MTTSDYLSCLCSAFLLVLVFPPFEFFFLLHFYALIPALFCLRPGERWHAFQIGWVTGVLYHLMLLYWLYMVTLPGMVLLCLYISVWFSLPFVVVAWVGPRWYLPLAFAATWYLQEQARAFGWMSFRWGYLGHGIYDARLLRQSVAYVGIEGLSFFVALSNIVLAGIIWYWIQQKKPIAFPYWQPRWTIGYVVFLALLLYPIIQIGFLRYSEVGTAISSTQERPAIALIQGGWPPGGENSPSFEEVLDTYLELSEEAIDEHAGYQLEPLKLIVWPESTITIPLNHWSDGLTRIREFVAEHNVPILMGCVHGDYHGNDEWDFYNRAWYFTPENVQEPFALEAVPFYDKMHLVPYGEWIPLGEVWPFHYIETLIEEAGAGIFQRGEGIQLFSLPDSELRFAVAICFESTLSWHAQQAKELGADFLVVITNDAWFEHSPGLAQHLLQSRFRATETQMPILRVSNVGITSVIDLGGQLVGDPLPANQPGVLVRSLPGRFQ